MSQRRKPPDPISAHSLAVRSVPQQAFTSRLRCHCRALGMRWSCTPCTVTPLSAGISMQWWTLETCVIVSTTINVDVLLLPWPLSLLATIESSFRSNAFLPATGASRYKFHDGARSCKRPNETIGRGGGRPSRLYTQSTDHRPGSTTSHPYRAGIADLLRPAMCMLARYHGVHAPRSPSAARAGRVLLSTAPPLGPRPEARGQPAGVVTVHVQRSCSALRVVGQMSR